MQLFVYMRLLRFLKCSSTYVLIFDPIVDGRLKLRLIIFRHSEVVASSLALHNEQTLCLTLDPIWWTQLNLRVARLA